MSGQRLFISHASEDEPVVNRIVTYLEAHGVSCWIAGRDIPPRAIYAEAITQGIQDCEACAVIVSKSANASAAIKRELELASHYNKPFIPIRVDATEPGPGLDYYLRNTQWINYGRDGERALDRIAAHMAGAPAPASYTPPPRPAERERKPIPIAALVVVAAIAVAATAGWFVLTQLPRGETQVAEVETPSETPNVVVEEPGPAPLESPDQRVERERLQRERDEALAAVRVLQEREREDRERREVANHSAAGHWTGTFSNDGARSHSWTLSDGGTFSDDWGNNGTWTQSGTTVTLNYGGGGSIFSGTIAGNQMTLTCCDGATIRVQRS